jgi:hypothetical protein
LQLWLHDLDGPSTALGTAAKARLLLQELGPTYVKVGQLISSRSQVLPDDWERELARLRQDVATFPYADVRRIVTEDLGVRTPDRSKSTVSKIESLTRNHIVPDLGARKLRDRGAGDVDPWLAGKPTVLSTSTVHNLHNYLSRSVARAMSRDLVRRNVVALATVPSGQSGRPSKALSLAQARALVDAPRAARSARTSWCRSSPALGPKSCGR